MTDDENIVRDYIGENGLSFAAQGEALAALSRIIARAEGAERERERIKAFLSDAGYETVQSEQAWKKRALAAEARANRLQAALDEAREALKPFADFVEGTDPMWADNRRIATLNYDFDKLTVGIFRRARAIRAAKREGAL
jgi:hypothetical protein